MTAMISLQQIEKRYPGTATPAVDGLRLDIAEGETVVLVGPSGCGKTTTMRMINRLIEPTGGELSSTAPTSAAGSRGAAPRDRLRDPEHRADAAPHRSAENMATVPKLLGWDDERTSATDRGADRHLRPRPRVARIGTRASSRAASDSGSAWPAPSPPTRP